MYLYAAAAISKLQLPAYIVLTPPIILVDPDNGDEFPARPAKENKGTAVVVKSILITGDKDKKNFRSLMTNRIEKDLLDKILIAMIEGNYYDCVKYYQNIKKNGYSNIDIIFNLISHVKIVDIKEDVRIKLMTRLSKTWE